MPIIAGGIYKNDNAKEKVQKLLQELAKQGIHDHTMVHNEEKGFMLSGGLLPLESEEERLFPLANNSGILIGRLFRKDFERNNINDLDIRKIEETKGAHLADNYWGRYLLFSQEQEGLSIYRDPQGLLTLFYVEIEGGFLFSSRLFLLYDALGKKLELNWRYLTSFVTNNGDSTSEVGFLNCVELLPGTRTTFYVDKDIQIIPFWDPLSYVKDLNYDENTLQEKLYETISNCTNSWIEQSPNVLLELSGGLDSSSLLAIIRNTNPHKNILSLNVYHSKIKSSNEITFAQDVADIYDSQLIQIEKKFENMFDLTGVVNRFDRPSSRNMNTANDSHSLNDFLKHKNDEIISGQGGDHLFLAGVPIEMGVDYYLTHGIKDTLQKLAEISSFHRMPFSSVIKKVMSDYVSFKRGTLKYISFAKSPPAWANGSFKALIDESIFKPNVWESLKYMPPGKAVQVFALQSAVLFTDRGENTGKITINPLLSQPVVELAFSIASYKSLNNGFDRYHYRKTMQRYTEGKFIWRKTKGEVSGALVLALREKFHFVRQSLLEGAFAREGLIDRSCLEEKLKLFRAGDQEVMWHIINLCSVENWIRSWQ